MVLSVYYLCLFLLIPKKLKAIDYWQGIKSGVQLMMPAIYILLFAWGIAAVIGDLRTGAYLASLMDGTVNPAYLPLLCFIVAGLMAFCTGSSFGNFLINVAGCW